MLEINTLLFHITRNENANLIEVGGIQLQVGNVNAYGRGFYTVENLANVFQWNHADNAEDFLNNYSVIFSRVTIETEIDLVAPVLAIDGPYGPGVLPLRRGGDLVWRNFNGTIQGSQAQNIEVIGNLTVNTINNIANNFLIPQPINVNGLILNNIDLNAIQIIANINAVIENL
ncbi:hypothetical protein [uncultured Chryseobacterium sp.]|uniref:hypothetical protein n=1 Tax=uncultured Chryseobacterium sp. TaxID=259322 RepID=UPI0025EED8B7|nr:hypothetical protein [uncultured Chryseobacterium sp.]